MVLIWSARNENESNLIIYLSCPMRHAPLQHSGRCIISNINICIMHFKFTQWLRLISNHTFHVAFANRIFTQQQQQQKSKTEHFVVGLPVAPHPCRKMNHCDSSEWVNRSNWIRALFSLMVKLPPQAIFRAFFGAKNGTTGYNERSAFEWLDMERIRNNGIETIQMEN